MCKIVHGSGVSGGHWHGCRWSCIFSSDLKQVLAEFVPRYIIARRKKEKTAILNKAYLQCLKVVQTSSCESRVVSRRQLQDAIYRQIRRMLPPSVGSRYMRRRHTSESDINQLIKWSRWMDRYGCGANKICRCFEKMRVGQACPMQWVFIGDCSEDILIMNRNLCTMKLFSNKSFFLCRVLKTDRVF